MKSGIPSALAVALLGLATIGVKTATAEDGTIRTVGYTHVSGTPAPTTSLNLPMQIPSSVRLPVHVTGSVPAATVGFHHRRYAAVYGPRYVYRPYDAPYVAYRPYYYPRPYAYGGFYAPYGAFYGGPGFYGGPVVYGRGYWGAYPGSYHW